MLTPSEIKESIKELGILKFCLNLILFLPLTLGLKILDWVEEKKDEK
jgi:hypothetical protein